MFLPSTKERIHGLPAIIYRRKSQEDKSRQILSLSTQEDICNGLTEAWNLRVLDDYSESKSAKTADQRPKFTEMMKRIESGKTEVIICWKIDRLVRNMKEGGWVIDLLQNGKLKAIVTKEKVYLPEDNTIITSIEMAGATEYSRELSKKVRDGNAKKARKGVPNRQAILGFLNNRHKEQGDRDWSDDPERWHYCQQALHKILKEGMVPSHAFKWLRDEIKMTTPIHRTTGGNLISKAVFYRFLKKTEIAGFIEHEGERIRINGCITPMITEDEYWILQYRIGSKAGERTRKKLSTYSGFIFSPEGDICTPCGVRRVTCDCKKRFSIKSKTECPECHTAIIDMVNPVFHESKYYYNSRLKNEKKKAKGLNEKMVDRAMIEMAESILLPPTLTTWSKNYLKELKDKEIADVSKVRESRNLHIKKLEKRKEKAKDAFLDGIFTKEEYQKEVEKLRMEEIHERTRPKEIDWFDISNSLTTLGREIIHIWQNGDIEEKRSLLDKLQVNHYWDEEKYSNSKPKSLELLISNIPAIRSEFALVEPVKNVGKQYDYAYMRMVSPTLCRTWDLIRTSALEENDSG